MRGTRGPRTRRHPPGTRAPSHRSRERRSCPAPRGTRCRSRTPRHNLPSCRRSDRAHRSHRSLQDRTRWCSARRPRGTRRWRRRRRRRGRTGCQRPRASRRCLLGRASRQGMGPKCHRMSPRTSTIRCPSRRTPHRSRRTCRKGMPLLRPRRTRADHTLPQRGDTRSQRGRWACSHRSCLCSDRARRRRRSRPGRRSSSKERRDRRDRQPTSRCRSRRGRTRREREGDRPGRRPPRRRPDRRARSQCRSPRGRRGLRSRGRHCRSEGGHRQGT